MLEGKEVSLRALEEEDLSVLKNWRNRKHVRKTTREYKLLNMINQKKWFELIHTQNPPRDIIFGIVDKKLKLVGFTALTYIDWKNRNAEISIYFAKENWQDTLQGKNALNLIIEYGFKELNLHRLWVEIFALSKENIKLYTKLKFVKEGVLRDKVWRDGKWWDSYIYSMILSDYQKKQSK
ncbi:GNAT family N-acetyltransferase [Candidatus Woesearchaeota archaeon]|jgi:RimJ/RimL family protein N-acetyltransferase|nr:GNAT family N-acetyltransferase [Candidatus Woesearchaeota archaeon]